MAATPDPSPSLSSSAAGAPVFAGLVAEWSRDGRSVPGDPDPGWWELADWATFRASIAATVRGLHALDDPAGDPDGPEGPGGAAHRTGRAGRPGGDAPSWTPVVPPRATGRRARGRR
ncbi:hypothetical protein ACN20G_32280 (plasmid) [Streptomyces sp. BI20]|uniref:hypothetical protein n=1 Tax=Streptomyces sp. BI20 TaxID=3403460 RepID=UPI003C78C1E0